MSDTNGETPTSPTNDEEFRWLRQELAQLPDPPMPLEVDAQVRAVIRTAGASAATSPKAGVRWLPLAAAAGAVVAASLAAIAVFSKPERGDSINGDAVMARAAMIQPISTETKYTRANIEERVQAHLTTFGTSEAVGNPASDEAKRGTFASDADSVVACVRALQPTAGDLNLLDLADYQGEPSGVLVFQAGAEALVVVVAPNCGQADPRVRLRLQTRVAAD